MQPAALPHSELLSVLFSAAVVLVEALTDPVALEQASLRQRVSAVNAVTSLLCQLQKLTPQPLAAPIGDSRQHQPAAAPQPVPAAAPSPRPPQPVAAPDRAPAPAAQRSPSLPSPAPRPASRRPVASRTSPPSADPHSSFLADYHTLTAAPSRLAALRLPRLHAFALNRSSLTAARPAA